MKRQMRLRSATQAEHHGLDLPVTLASLAAEDLDHTGTDGAITVAYPFSGRPAAHRVQLDVHEVHAMCAIDALGIAPMFGRPIRVAVGRFLAEPDTMNLGATATRLDALGALGDRQRVEEEATPLLRPGTYLEPFAPRALGGVRADRNLVERAAAHFEQMGLPWHAAQTRLLIPVAT
ncbi:MAG: organomercurial lyase [Gaiellaceae bacterium]